jgi:hypothetical protein
MNIRWGRIRTLNEFKTNNLAALMTAVTRLQIWIHFLNTNEYIWTSVNTKWIQNEYIESICFICIRILLGMYLKISRRADLLVFIN